MYKETTKPLLRPNQVESLKEEAKRLEATLQMPPHIAAAIQDPGEMRRQLRNIAGALDTQSPKPYGEGERDAAVAREAELRDEIVEGMPTGKEMRRNPAGNVDKHRGWERRNKEKILEWKNIRLRMHASEMLDELPDASDVANFERYRPTQSSGELNMHNEQIPGKVQYGPQLGLGLPTVFSESDKKLLQEIDPELADCLATLDNQKRASIKAYLQEVMEIDEQEARIVDELPAKKKK